MEDQMPPVVMSFAPSASAAPPVTHQQIADTWDKVVSETIQTSGVRAEEKAVDWSAPRDKEAFDAETERLREEEEAKKSAKKGKAPAKRKRRTKAEIAAEAEAHAAAQHMLEIAAMEQANAQASTAKALPTPPAAKQPAKRATSKSASSSAADPRAFTLCRQIQSYKRLGEKRHVQGKEIDIGPLQDLHPVPSLGVEALEGMKETARKCLHINDGAKMAKMAFRVGMSQYDAFVVPVVKDLGYDISGTSVVLNSPELKEGVDECLEELGIESFDGTNIHPALALASMVVTASCVAAQVNADEPGSLQNLAAEQAAGNVE